MHAKCTHINTHTHTNLTTTHTRKYDKIHTHINTHTYQHIHTLDQVSSVRLLVDLLFLPADTISVVCVCLSHVYAHSCNRVFNAHTITHTHTHTHTQTYQPLEKIPVQRGTFRADLDLSGAVQVARVGLRTTITRCEMRVHMCVCILV
jgi:hypothetical protein